MLVWGRVLEDRASGPSRSKSQEGLLSSLVKIGGQWIPLRIEQACLQSIIKELGSQAQSSSPVTQLTVCTCIN